MDHDRQYVSTPATRCAAGIMPVAVSLSNGPARASGPDLPSAIAAGDTRVLAVIREQAERISRG
jgi:hypothetical protein